MVGKPADLPPKPTLRVLRPVTEFEGTFAGTSGRLEDTSDAEEMNAIEVDPCIAFNIQEEDENE